MSTVPPGRKKVMVNGVEVGELDSTGDHEQDIEALHAFLKAEGLHREISAFEGAQQQAVAFANTAAYLYERDLKRSPRNGVSGVPFVVNAAFSIELYLKALALKHGVALRGHELVKLHQALPEQAIADIVAVTDQCAKRRNLGETADLRAYLEQLNNSFVEWRYSYEAERTGAVHIEPTIFVMELLHAACQQARPGA